MELLDPKEKQDLWQEMQELLDIREKKRSRHLVGVVGLFFLSLIHISEPTRPY